MGFAKWQVPNSLTPEQHAEKERCEAEKILFPEGANVPLIDAFIGRLNEMREVWRDVEKDYCTYTIFTPCFYL